MKLTYNVNYDYSEGGKCHGKLYCGNIEVGKIFTGCTGRVISDPGDSLSLYWDDDIGQFLVQTLMGGKLEEIDPTEMENVLSRWISSGRIRKQ